MIGTDSKLTEEIWLSQITYEMLCFVFFVNPNENLIFNFCDCMLLFYNFRLVVNIFSITAARNFPFCKCSTLFYILVSTKNAKLKINTQYTAWIILFKRNIS